MWSCCTCFNGWSPLKLLYLKRGLVLRVNNEQHGAAVCALNISLIGIFIFSFVRDALQRKEETRPRCCCLSFSSFFHFRAHKKTCCSHRGARCEAMWWWGSVCVHIYIYSSGGRTWSWWLVVSEQLWTITEFTPTQTSTACSRPRLITRTLASDRWRLRWRRPAAPSAPTLEVRDTQQEAAPCPLHTNSDGFVVEAFACTGANSCRQYIWACRETPCSRSMQQHLCS